MSAPEVLRRWHAVVDSGDAAGLGDLLAEDCVFRSPAVHTPQEGRALTTAYLTAALEVLGPTLSYVHEWYDDTSAVLEFTATVDGYAVHGIDMLRWREDRVTEFTVMARPIKGLTALMGPMAERLQRPASG